MARLPYLDVKDLAPEHHDLLARKINLNKLLVHSPEAARAFGKLGGHIRFKSKLEPLARAVLKAAREMTNDLKLSDATHAELKQHMNAETLVELVVAISFYNGVVRLLSALQIDVEDDYKHYLDEFPLP